MKYFFIIPDDPFWSCPLKPKPYSTLEEAYKEAKYELKFCRENCLDGWPEDMSQYNVVDETGWIHYRYKQINRVQTPSDVDENGYSESLHDYFDARFEYRCDYVLERWFPPTDADIIAWGVQILVQEALSQFTPEEPLAIFHEKIWRPDGV